MSLKNVLWFVAAAMLAYSAVPLVGAATSSGLCCSVDSGCPNGYVCLVTPGDDCGLPENGYCISIPSNAD